jgi:ABC-type branched-subunit amino acid transport system substrate-binding protein
MQGGTTYGGLGYSIAPTSVEAAKSNGVSAEAAGLKTGYIDAHFPFGSTNVQPTAIAMKNAGVGAIAPEVDPNTSFALINALRTLGATPKVALLPIGYGADLLEAGPATINSAQNVYISIFYEPMEMNSPATQAFKAALTSVGFTGVPNLRAYDAYASVLMLLQGLKAAGASPTKASLIGALSNIHDFDAGGLYGDHHLDPNDRDNLGAGPGNCLYFTKVVGSGFQLVDNAEPLCGDNLPGKTVTPS